jgi:hypothetical protein
MSEINYEFEDEEVYQNQDSQPTNKKKSSSSKLKILNIKC